MADLSFAEGSMASVQKARDMLKTVGRPIADDVSSKSTGLTLVPPLVIEDATLESDVKALLESLHSFRTLVEQYRAGTIGAGQLAQASQHIRTAITRLEIEADPQIKDLLARIKDAWQTNPNHPDLPMWGWQFDRGTIYHFARPGQSTDIGNYGTSVEAISKAWTKFSEGIAALPVFAVDSTFSAQHDRMMPAIEKAKLARDDAASVLTLKPSDSMTLANLHQKQADYNVLFQALSSALRNEQRIVEMLINNIAR